MYRGKYYNSLEEATEFYGESHLIDNNFVRMLTEKDVQRLVKEIVIDLGTYLESEHGKAYRFAVQKWLERHYKIGTYESDWDKEL